MTNSPYINIDYDELKPDTYRGVQVFYTDTTVTKPDKTFNTDNPVEDLAAAEAYVAKLGFDPDMCYSSSVQDYLVDAHLITRYCAPGETYHQLLASANTPNPTPN